MTLTCHVMIMANTYTNSFIHNIGLNEEKSLSNLLERISPEIENETDLIEHSKYYNDVDFKNLLHNATSKIRMLSLNCQSINAKFDKLKLFLDDVSIEHPISDVFRNHGVTRKWKWQFKLIMLNLLLECLRTSEKPLSS